MANTSSRASGIRLLLAYFAFCVGTSSSSVYRWTRPVRGLDRWIGPVVQGAAVVSLGQAARTYFQRSEAWQEVCKRKKLVATERSSARCSPLAHSVSSQSLTSFFCLVLHILVRCNSTATNLRTDYEKDVQPRKTEFTAQDPVYYGRCP